MFAIDTNILVYAHNIDSPLYKKAKIFVENVVEHAHEVNGYRIVGIPLQVCAEFINVVTREAVGKPLSLKEAIGVIKEYTQYLEIPILFPQETQLRTFLSLLEETTSRKKVFDVALAATLKDNKIEGIYTVNVDDFKDFDFLKVENPLTQAG
jgi:predicted nucleic acid-binding protein